MVTQEMSEALDRARGYVLSQGGRFVHVLQPQLFSLAAPTNYERWVIENELKQMPGLDRAVARAYPQFRRCLEHCKANRMETYDLSDALDAHSAEEEYYLDYVHVGHLGNERLAQAIYEAVFGRAARDNH